MNLYSHLKSLARSEIFSVRINDRVVVALHTGVADFSILALDPTNFPPRVEITVPHSIWQATLHPLAKNLSATAEGCTVRFTLDRPEKLSVAIPGHKAFYLFSQLPETNSPAPGAHSVVTFPAGQITELPMLTLEDGKTLYLSGGAMLKTRIHVKGKSSIRICGHGIFDGSYFSKDAGDAVPSIIVERCPGVIVEDIVMVRPQSWMLVVAACEGATVRNLKQIGQVMSSDGIDVVGSRDVLIEDCFLHNNDDYLVIKAFNLGEKNVSATSVAASENVENVMVRHCNFASWESGNAMEIGHELSADLINNITFRDIDVLHAHRGGAVFSLHNNDRALISNVLFEDICIEHCYDKLIEFRISKSFYSEDNDRGSIQGVTLRCIQWRKCFYNKGYTISLIGGWDGTYTIAAVVIEDFQINGTPVHHLDELEISTRHCHNLPIISYPANVTKTH